jgi:hypothetical protein
LKRLARACEFCLLLPVHKRGASPPESIQSLTCLLLQHPPASAENTKHFACQLPRHPCNCHVSVIRQARIFGEFGSGAMPAVNLPR